MFGEETEKKLTGSTVISATDEVRLALNDDRASIVSPIAVDVES
jgi:hypothetical protein